MHGRILALWDIFHDGLCGRRATGDRDYAVSILRRMRYVGEGSGRLTLYRNGAREMILLFGGIRPELVARQIERFCDAENFFATYRAEMERGLTRETLLFRSVRNEGVCCRGFYQYTETY